MSLQLLTILSPTTPCIPILLLTALARDRSRNVRTPFTGRFPFLASPLRRRLANASGRIEFIIVLFMDWSFASSCSPPRLSTSQLLSATDRPVLLSDWDFHPIVGAHFQAHISRAKARKLNDGAFVPGQFSQQSKAKADTQLAVMQDMSKETHRRYKPRIQRLACYALLNSVRSARPQTPSPIRRG